MNRITRYIEGRKAKKILRELQLKYHIACNDLSSFKNALPRSDRHGYNILSIQLRNAIADLEQECQRLRGAKERMGITINRLKRTNVIGTTG